MKTLVSLLAGLLFSTSTAIVHAQAVNSQDRDIGAVAVAGSAANNGTAGFTITASGADIWGTADEFHYVYFPLDGDMEIVGRVTGIDFTDGWAKAGLMARESLDANSRNFMVFMAAQDLSGIQWRATTGGNSDYLGGGSAAIPQWIKLVRSGNTFSGYRSTDGANWTLIGSTTISLPSSIYVGLAVTSHHDGTLCTATFDNVTHISGGGGGTSGVPAAPSGLTATPYSSNEILLSWTDNANDETYFRVERSTDGVNFQELTPRPPSDATKMYDSGLSPSTHYWYRIYAVNSAGSSAPSNVADVTTPGSGGGSTSGWQHQDIGDVSAAGNFNQSGNTYTVGGSGADIWGTSDECHYAWQFGTGNVQIVARITGMANTSPWAKAGVMIRPNVVGNDSEVLLALTPSHGLAFQWRSTAVGDTSYIDAGPASTPVWVKLVQTADTVTGYRSADGNNWTEVASVTSGVNSSAPLAGLAVTSHNDGTVCIANFDNVTITSSGGGGGGGTSGVPAAPSNLTAAPSSSTQINLSWKDNSSNETGFILERSTDGTSFQQIGTFVANNQTAVEVVNPGTHHWYRVAATNSFGRSPYSNVADATTPTGGGGGAALPAPWQSQNVGNVGVLGSASESQGTFTLKGSGADIWGTSDAFYFAYQTVSGRGDGAGNVELTARVTGLQNTDPWAKAGIMFRQVLSANFANVGNAKNVFVMATPDHGTGIQSRSATGGGSSYLPGPYFTAPVWLRLRREGNVFTGYSSLDGVNWTVIGSQTVSTDSPVVAGLAVTSHNNGVLNTVTFDNVNLTLLP